MVVLYTSGLTKDSVSTSLVDTNNLQLTIGSEKLTIVDWALSAGNKLNQFQIGAETYKVSDPV